MSASSPSMVIAAFASLMKQDSWFAVSRTAKRETFIPGGDGSFDQGCKRLAAGQPPWRAQPLGRAGEWLRCALLASTEVEMSIFPSRGKASKTVTPGRRRSRRWTRQHAIGNFLLFFAGVWLFLALVLARLQENAHDVGFKGIASLFSSGQGMQANIIIFASIALMQMSRIFNGDRMLPIINLSCTFSRRNPVVTVSCLRA